MVPLSLTQSPLAAPGCPAQWSAAGFEVAAPGGGPAVSSYCPPGVAHRSQRWELVRGLCAGREEPPWFSSFTRSGFPALLPPSIPPACPWDVGLSASGEESMCGWGNGGRSMPTALWDHRESTPSSGFLRADCMPSVRHRKHSRLPLDTWEVRPSCPAGQRGYQPQSG